MAIRDRLEQLEELDKRREAFVKSREERKLMTEVLAAKIAAAESLNTLEDIYLPFQPKKKTKATIARELGLEPLADLWWAQDATTDPHTAARLACPRFSRARCLRNCSRWKEMRAHDKSSSRTAIKPPPSLFPMAQSISTRPPTMPLSHERSTIFPTNTPTPSPYETHATHPALALPRGGARRHAQRHDEHRHQRRLAPRTDRGGSERRYWSAMGTNLLGTGGVITRFHSLEAQPRAPSARSFRARRNCAAPGIEQRIRAPTLSPP